jgi:TnpA family transposase
MNELLSPEDIILCRKKAEVSNQLMFGIMLNYFRKNIKFPFADETYISPELIIQTAFELDINQDGSLDFAWNSRTCKRYRNEIRIYLEFREATDSDAPKFIEHLISEILPHHPSYELLREQTRLYFYKNRIELFKSQQLNRYISSSEHKFEQNLFHELFDNLSKNSLLLIDQILVEHTKNTGSEIIELSELKKDIPGARLKHVESAINKITLLSKIQISESITDNVNRKILLKYHDRIMALSPSNILEFNTEAKYASMALFCHVRLQSMLDSLCETFQKLIKRMRSNAENYIDRYILKEVKRVDGKFDILEKLASVSLNNPKGIIEEKVYSEVSKDKLADIIADLQQRGKWYQQQVQNKLHSNYVHGSRTILLSILDVLVLKEDHATYSSVIKAVEFIRENQNNPEYYTHNPPVEGVIPTNWLSMVVFNEKDKIKVNKYNYELAVLEQLRCFLSFKGIWIDGSYLYRDPNKDIPKDFNIRKKEYYKLIDVPENPKDFVRKLKETLGAGLKNLNSNIPGNSPVQIKKSRIGKNITISPSEAQKEPENIDELQKNILQKWSSINLIDILKECDLLINFTQQMGTVSKSSSIDSDDLRKRLLLCLYGIGSNTGLKRISIANGDVNYEDLRYVKKRYVNAVNVRNAIRLVINNVLKIRDPGIWGEATTSVACDSTQVSAWDQNLINEWHHRYRDSGVMIYWHVDKKSLCIYSQLKTCSSSEVGSMIKGILDHDTEMNMNRVFVDTHGQSVIGFAVSYLLKFELLPRFKAINKQKLCGATSKDKKKYSNISEIIKGTINWKLIEDNYEEMIKYMVALKLGIIEPGVLVKRFSTKNYDHPVYRALHELGKANKSIFLCKYLNSEDLRIEVNEGLNIVERLNNVMDFIFYGKLGEIKTNKTEDQELAVLCLHLLQACMVYINTLIIQQVLSGPYWKNKLTSEDYRALTPLFAGHINPYGLFPVDLTQRILNLFQYTKGKNYT